MSRLLTDSQKYLLLSAVGDPNLKDKLILLLQDAAIVEGTFATAADLPTDNVLDGSIAVTLDTSSIYVYDENTLSWINATGMGLTSLNGLTAASQTFSIGTAGTNFNVSSAGSVHTFNLPDASATNRGAITTGTQTIGGNKTLANNLSILGQLLLADGDVNAPSAAFTAVPGMGFYRTGANHFSIGIAGEPVARLAGIDSGFVFKGSQSFPLEIRAALSNSAGLRLYHDNAGDAVVENGFASGNMRLITNGSTRVTIASSDGQVNIATRLGVEAGNGTDSTARIRGLTNTGVNQWGLIVDTIHQSTATGSGYAIECVVKTAAAAFSMASGAAFNVGTATVGAGSAITRLVNYLGVVQTAGTNNAFLADNSSFSGNYFIHSNSSRPSSFNGGIGVNEDATTQNIATFRKDQNASTRLLLTNNDPGASADARLYLINNTGSMFMAVDTEAAIVSNSNFAAFTLSQPGVKPLRLATNSIVRLNVTGAGDVQVSTGDLSVETAGKGLKIKEGSNAKMGIATLVGGTVVVSTTAVTANSRIMLTHQNSSGTVGFVIVSARTAATSFTILSSSGTDTSNIAWMIVEPA